MLASRDGNNHCHCQVTPALGYLRSSPSGSQTPGKPAVRSSANKTRNRDRCCRSGSISKAGRIVTRSLSPLPPAIEVGILDPQPQQLHQTHPRAIHQFNHQAGCAVHVFE